MKYSIGVIVVSLTSFVALRCNKSWGFVTKTCETWGVLLFWLWCWCCGHSICWVLRVLQCYSPKITYEETWKDRSIITSIHTYTIQIVWPLKILAAQSENYCYNVTLSFFFFIYIYILTLAVTRQGLVVLHLLTLGFIFVVTVFLLQIRQNCYNVTNCYSGDIVVSLTSFAW